MTLNAFTLAVVALALEVPLSVTSWIRSPARNGIVGGHPDSYHLSALAVDVVPDNPADTDKIKARAARLGLKALNEGSHIHLQPSS